MAKLLCVSFHFITLVPRGVFLFKHLNIGSTRKSRYVFLSKVKKGGDSLETPFFGRQTYFKLKNVSVFEKTTSKQCDKLTSVCQKEIGISQRVVHL